MVQKEIENLIFKAVSDIFLEEKEIKIEIEIPKEKNHGDYSTNVALKIAKNLKKNPMEIAQKITDKLEKDENIDRAEVCSPGFINFFISKKHLQEEALRVLEEKDQYGSSQTGKGKKVIIDYSSPNIAKSFGIGHLRSTIIGQAIYNIYEFNGWDCIGDNHLGDWGTQFGKLIYQIKEEKLEEKESKERKKTLESLTINELESLYVDFHKKAQNNPELEEKGRFWFSKLENGDEEAREIWKHCVEISKKEFDRIYNLLNIEIEYALGESFYSEMIPEIVEELKTKKIIKKSDNALIVDFSNKLPSIVAIKSDKTTTYLIRDLATIKYRINRWNPDLFIYEVGADQSLYFKQLFETVEMLGWKRRDSFFHVAHGLVRWKHGKFSTRRGETVHLEKILQESIKKAFEIIKKSENVKDVSEKEKEEIAKIVGIGAVKYNDLSQHYQKDIIFDWEKMLNLKGNSGPYLQYTFARCSSVLRKSKPVLSSEKFTDLNEEEKEILRGVIKFKNIVKEAKDTLSPNIICNFLFDLAQRYNLFYNNNRIIQEDKEIEKTRLILTAVTAQILKNGLGLLGIDAPDKM